MRSIQTLGWTCIAAMSCGAAAEEPVSPAIVSAALDPAIVTHWADQARPSRPDRLRYLEGPQCVEQRGCSMSGTTPPREPERDYIDALSLGDYGPMNVKFNGKRVKVKLRF